MNALTEAFQQENSLAARPPSGFGHRVKLLVLLTAGTLMMTIGSVAMLLVSIVTLFQTRRYCREVMAKWMGRAGLRLAGIRVHVHNQELIPAGQVVYVSNHTSTLDVFILISLGLANARFFLSGFLRKILPLGLIGYLIGIFWTVPQKFPQRRTVIFQRAERTLRRTGESVYLSPEGRRVTTGKIGHFNKGAFHLATNLGAPIVPFYINTPRSIDPGTGYSIKPGDVHVHFQPPIATSDWRIEDLERNRGMVQDVFVRLNQQLQTI